MRSLMVAFTLLVGTILGGSAGRLVYVRSNPIPTRCYIPPGTDIGFFQCPRGSDLPYLVVGVALGIAVVGVLVWRRLHQAM